MLSHGRWFCYLHASVYCYVVKQKEGMDITAVVSGVKITFQVSRVIDGCGPYFCGAVEKRIWRLHSSPFYADSLGTVAVAVRIYLQQKTCPILL